ncbi:MAG TPA: MarR family transcriptional regulator [Candidimonas sp.]|nr:MarR family transcriptional regulator [Candidimonas sp.]
MTSYHNTIKTAKEVPTTADYHALAMFRLALRRFMAFSEAAAATQGLMPQQHQALLIIKALGVVAAPSVGAVAEHLLIRHHSAVELINRLVRMDLVRRIRDPDDGRRVLVALTPLAEGKLAELSATHLEELRSVRPMLIKMLGHFDR